MRDKSAVTNHLFPLRDREPRGTLSAWLAIWAACLLLGVAMFVARALPSNLWQLTHVQSVSASKADRPSIPCLSYAPFRRSGHTPMNPTLRLTDEQLLEDLRLMAQWTGCIRTYGTSHGQDRIPALATTVGLQVVQGAWVSRDRMASQREVDTALALAHAHPATVRMVMVGNEVLLRQERSPQELAELLREAKQRSPVPVAYADVWEFWLRHATVLAPEVDVVAAHLLPYWEDVPIGLDEAVSHVVAIHRQMTAAFSGKPVWIAETGWPSAGRQRGPALPGAQEQAAFVRQLRERLQAEGIDFNLIEAFDQPWKRQFEGAMGGAWGLADASGRLRDAGQGPWPVDPLARGALLGGLSGLMASLAMAVVAARLRHRRSDADPDVRGLPIGSSLAPLMVVVFTGLTIGLFMGIHVAGLPIWLRSTGEWVLGVFQLLLAGLVCVACLNRLLQQRRCQPPCETGTGPLPSILVQALLFTTAWQALTLIVDGRYRPLHAFLAAAPAVGLWLVRAYRGPHPMGRGGALLLAIIAVSAPVLVIVEGWQNTQALALAAAWLLMVVALWPNRRRVAHQQASAADAESSGGAVFAAASAQHSAAKADRSAS